MFDKLPVISRASRWRKFLELKDALTTPDSGAFPSLSLFLFLFLSLSIPLPLSISFSIPRGPRDWISTQGPETALPFPALSSDATVHQPGNVR